MNYYEHHLGDYAKDTAHLTMLEHGAYRLLLDRYYGTEQGIPADQAHRVARARSKEEKAAVDCVLDEFFQLVDGIWINSRAEEEIIKASAKINAAKENGKKGGRPKKQNLGSENETQEKPAGFSMGSEKETQQKAHQAPSTKHQAPSKPLPPPSESEPLLPAPDADVAASSADDDSPIPETPLTEGQWLAWFNREEGACLDPGSRFDRKGVWPVFTRWCRASITQQQVRAAIREARATATSPIANLPKYVDRVLENAQAPPRMSAADQSKLAAARTIFGTEIEGNRHGNDHRVIDVTPAPRTLGS